MKDARRELRQRIEAATLPANLGALLDLAIERHGDSPAWIFVDQGEKAPISYAELGEMVARAANVFDAIGVRKGSHVGVMLPNVPDSLVAWLAIARIGARMVPINPGYTPDELKYWLTDGDVAFLLMDASRLATLDAVAADAPLLRRDGILLYGSDLPEGHQSWTRLLQSASTSFTPRVPVDLDDIVNIQYTSGSTGWPKGCLLSHRYWIQAGKVFHEVWPPFKRIQCDLPFYYMGPLWRFALAAFNGAALCVPPSYSLSRFRERICEYDYDMAWATNPVVLLDPSPLERQHKLKMIAIFGLSPSLHGPLQERYGVPARDSYGMTEIGITTYTPIDDDTLTGKGSCGIASPFRELRITDPEGNELPVGEIGELCVAGAGILQGYYKKPEATAAAFRGKWFRTGDLARADERGNFYIVGRIKDMIRRSGENISVTEVEAALALMPEVEDVAVHGVNDEKRGEEVKACIILKPGYTPANVGPEVVIAHCRNHLTRFKVPRYVQFYAEFPKTGSNKIAKKRLADGEGVVLTPVFDEASVPEQAMSN